MKKESDRILAEILSKDEKVYCPCDELISYYNRFCNRNCIECWLQWARDKEQQNENYNDNK